MKKDSLREFLNGGNCNSYGSSKYVAYMVNDIGCYWSTPNIHP